MAQYTTTSNLLHLRASTTIPVQFKVLTATGNLRAVMLPHQMIVEVEVDTLYD